MAKEKEVITLKNGMKVEPQVIRSLKEKRDHKIDYKGPRKKDFADKSGKVANANISGNFKSPLHKNAKFTVGANVFFKTYGVYCKITEANEEGVILDNPINKGVLIKYSDAKGCLAIVPSNHIGILVEYEKRGNLANLLLKSSLKDSMEIIKNSGFTVKNYKKMKPFLVPKILNNSQWNSWTNRIRLITYRAKNVLRVNTEPEIKEIGPQDFLVRTDTFKCSKEDHSLISIRAQLLIRTSKNDLYMKLFPAGYCKKCKHYYILSTTFKEHYNEIKNTVSDIILEKDLEKHHTLLKSNETKYLIAQSTLSRCGYTVSQDVNYNEEERLEILAQIIKLGVLNKLDIITSLDRLINKNMYNLNMDIALEKWRADLKNIRQLSVEKDDSIKPYPTETKITGKEPSEPINQHIYEVDIRTVRSSVSVMNTENSAQP